MIGLKGKIRSLSRDRSFGFIIAESGEMVSFYRSAFEGEDFDALQEGTPVEFNLERGAKGLQAVNIRTVKS